MAEPASTELSDVRKERFNLNLFYLKSEESVHKFIRKLPGTIKFIDAKRLERDDIHTYADHKISYNVIFESSMDNALVLSEVLKLWEINLRSIESMSWLQLLPRKRLSCMSPQQSREILEKVEILGGSMISPINFVRHWETVASVASVEFQQDKSLLVIANSEIKMEINMWYNFLHNFIIVDLQESETIFYINVKSTPKLFQNTDFHSYEGTKRIPASEYGYEKFGHLDCFCIRFKKNSTIVSRISCFLQCVDISIAYACMKVDNCQDEVTVDFEGFEMAYAWKSMCSQGFKVVDHLTPSVVEKIVQMGVSSHMLCIMVENIAEKPFINFMDEFSKATEMTKQLKEEDVPRHYLMVRRVLLTPSKCVLLPKEPILQNGIVRQYNEDYFLRLAYRDEDYKRLNAMQPYGLDCIFADLKRFFNKGLTIYDRHYELLGCSNGQLREHGFWFYSSHDGITAAFIREKHGNFSEERSFASYVSHFGLSFSEYNLKLDAKICTEEVIYDREFQMSGICLIDCIGKISTKTATEIAKEMNIKAVPSAFQIHYNGCKGVVVQDPLLEQGITLFIRQSLKRHQSSSSCLEILKTSYPGRLYLNRKIISLLSGFGVPDDAFQDLQESMLFELADMLLYDEKALTILKEISLDIKFQNLFEKGISFVREPFFRSLLLRVYHHRLDDLKQRTRIQIDVDKGRNMIGTSDKSRSLKYGQVFIQYSKDPSDAGKKLQIVLGKVLVTKYPSIHPEDLQIFEAVDVPGLRHVVDCIVFPQCGPRPFRDEMSPSDDIYGDEYFVLWDKRFLILKNKINSQNDSEEKLASDVQGTNMADFLVNYLKNDHLEIIAESHLARSDSEQEGIFSDCCIELAEMYSGVLDCLQTGKSPQIRTEFLPQKYPDFMMKRDKILYYSSRILGKLFRQNQMLQQNILREKTFEFAADEDLILLPSEEECRHAILQRNLYNDKLLRIMKRYGIKDESAAITGLIQDLISGKGYSDDEKIQIGKIVRDQISLLFRKTRVIFFEEFGGERSRFSLESASQIFRKASIWYTVTYKMSSPRFLSFPWVVGDILCLVKKNQEFKNVFENIERSFESRWGLLVTERTSSLDKLRKLRHKVEQNTPSGVRLEWINLSGNGIVIRCPDNHHFLGIRTKNSELGILTIKYLNSFATSVKSGPFEGELCYQIKLAEGVEGFITLIVNEMILTQSKLLNEFLDKSTPLKHVAHFLFECLWEHTLTKIPMDLIADMLPIMLLKKSFDNIDISKSYIRTRILIDCLKNIRRYIQSISAPSEIPRTSLQWLKNTEEEIIQRCLVVYHEIACHAAVDISCREENDQLETYFSCILPVESWSTVEYAKEYAKFKLMKITGIDVSIHLLDFGLINGIKIEAVGTDIQLMRLNQALFDLSVKSKKITATKSGQTTIDGTCTFTMLFEGSRQENDEVIFLPHRGLCQHNHTIRKRYHPRLRNHSDGCSENFFQSSFLLQWDKIRDEYSDIFHGDLSIVLAFGTFYIMDIEKRHMPLSELNETLQTFEERRERLKSETHGNGHVCVPYSFAFLPMQGESDDLKRFLHAYFNRENVQRNVKVRIGRWGMCDLDDHLHFLQLEVPQIKWFIGQIIRKTTQENEDGNSIDIRCKIQSFRNLNRHALQTVGGHGDLLNHSRSGALIRKNSEGFIINNNNITFIREKETEIYSNKTLNIQERIWRTLRVEVSRVKEYRVKSCRCKKISERTEVVVVPFLPDIKSSDEEIRQYAKQLWETALFFANKFDK